MGRVLLVGRLVAGDLRRRPGEAVLLVMTILAGTTILTIGLLLHGVTSKPYQNTREVTAGPDVVAVAAPDPLDPRRPPADLAGLEALADVPGVVAHSGPYPVVRVDLRTAEHHVEVQAMGRDRATTPVDQPAVAEGGSWVEDGGVVFEAAFADSLGIDVGDPVTIADRSFRVVGIAVSAATPPYPDVNFCLSFPCIGDAGIAWLTTDDVRSLAGPEESVGYVLNVRLADPAAAPSFVAEYTNRPPLPAGMSWQEILEDTERRVSDARRALVTGGWLLAVVAVASVAVLAGGRMADQTRRVGLLKAVGGTPGAVAAVLLAEYLALALLAAGIGLAVGWRTAPTLADPGAGLLGRAGTPPLTASTICIVVAVAVGVAGVASAVPALRASRMSTVLALADSARAPRRTTWLIALSSRLPVALLLGTRVVARRPRRVLLSGAGILVTISGIVAVLGAHADLTAERRIDVDLSSRADELDRLLLLITLTLVALAACNAIFVTWATAIDARHVSAVSRALGATGNQVSAGLSLSQVLPAVIGALLGIPGGLLLLAAVDPGEGMPVPPAWQLLAVVPTTAVVVAALTIVPARIVSRRPVAATLAA